MRVLAILGAAALAAGCGQPTDGRSGPRLSPAALASPPREIPLEIDAARVELPEGRFAAARYTIQGSQIRLTFVTTGGPYRLTIERLVVVPQTLRANAETAVGFTATGSGDHIMRIEETGASAILSIRTPAGP